MREFHVLNLGAGVQSTCLYLLAREPDATLRFDVAIFADTGEEPAAVYRHLDYLRSLGQPEIWTRSAGKLGDDLIHGRKGTGQRFASIPAFTAEDHLLRPGSCEHRLPPAPKYGRVRRQCTSEYKIQVIERAIRREVVGLKPRQRMPKDVRVFQYFGITTDEGQRAERAKRRFEKLPWAVPVYPFLEMGWSRQDCEALLEDRLPHPVPRSACVFCPYRTNKEWLRLKQTDPDGWRRAVEIDHALRTEGHRGQPENEAETLPAPQLRAARRGGPGTREDAVPPHDERVPGHVRGISLLKRVRRCDIRAWLKK